MDYLGEFRRARIKHGLTLEQVGMVVGHTKQYMHQIEKGKTKLSYELAVKLADVLEIDLPINNTLSPTASDNEMKKRTRVIRRLRLMTRRTLRTCVGPDLDYRTMYLMSIADRAIRLADGFVILLTERNLTCASAVLRMMLDNCLRTYAYTLAADKDAVAKRVLQPDADFRKMKAKDGKNLTDKYLVEQLTKLDESIGSVYRSTSGYIHHSSKALYNMASLVGNRTFSFNIGGPLTEDWDITLLECAEAFIRYMSLNNRLLIEAVSETENHY